MTSTPSLSRVHLAILYPCFFFSGAAALIYEVVWAKYLSLYMGSTGQAHIIVLATFMGGLALGSHVVGRFTDRFTNPLAVFAFLELAIGLCAVFFEPVYGFNRSVFLWVVNQTGVTPGGLLFGKILGSVLTILLPTFLMGGTLPVLARHFLRAPALTGHKISLLYFLNSLGAVFGCVLAGFFLIRLLGLHASLLTGAMFDIGAGIVALALSKRTPAAAAGADAAPPIAPVPKAPEPGRKVFILLLSCAGLSGAVSMMYEVAWIRMLTLVIGSSTYSFSLMLATFILGLSLGGWVLSWRKKPTGYTTIFGLAEIGVGLMVLLSLPFYTRLPFTFNRIASHLARDPETFPLYQVSMFLLCAAVMLPPTLLQGITLPAATKILLPNLEGVGKRVGLVLAVNTAGTMLGAVFAGVVGLPRLGIKGTLELAVLLNVLLGLAVLSTLRDARWRNAVMFRGGAAALAVGMLYLFTMGDWNHHVFTIGAYRIRGRVASHAELLQRAAQRKMIYHRDGIDASVAVQDIGDNRVLVINGKVDASTGDDIFTQKSLAHVPALLHPHPRKVLVIGLGSGATVGSVLTHPDVERVDVVELSREVIEASRYFETINHRFWEDPRVHEYREDAKTFLQVTPRQYDLIISEPSNPWMAGVAGVFSEEFFDACLTRLAPGGLFTQWLHAYELEDGAALMILETFSSRFPFHSIWNPLATDILLVGAPVAHPLSPETFLTRAGEPTVIEDFNALDWPSAMPLLLTQMAEHTLVRHDAPILGRRHSDFFPALEYLAPRGFFVGETAAAMGLFDQRALPASHHRMLVHRVLETEPFLEAEWEAFYRTSVETSSAYPHFNHALARAWLRQHPESPSAQHAVHGNIPPGWTDRMAALPNDEPSLALLRRLASRLLEEPETRGDWLNPPGTAELEVLHQRIRNHPDHAPTSAFTLEQAQLAYRKGDFTHAASLATEALSLLSQADTTLQREIGVIMVKTALRLGSPEAAEGIYQRLLATHQHDLNVRLLNKRIQDLRASP